LLKLFWPRRPAAPPAEVAAGPLVLKPPGPGGKVLIVDDDAVVLKSLSLRLGKQGYEVVTARDASEGIAAVRDERPDVVLLDLSFPPDICSGGRHAWDGFQIISLLRNLEEARGVPFIIVSGCDPIHSREKALKAGAVAFFQKPVSQEELLWCIKEAMEGKKG
jgi:CheY-like chemotaxis protein